MKEAAYKALLTPGIPFKSIEVVSAKEGIRSPLSLEFRGKAKEVCDDKKICVFMSRIVLKL